MLFDLLVLGTDPAGLEAARLAYDLGQSVAIVDDPDHFEAQTLAKAPLPNMGHFNGMVKFLAWDSLEIADSARAVRILARRILLAMGTKAKRPVHVPFDGQKILTSDEILKRETLPQNVLIVGAGEHGIRCAAQLAKRGVRVSLVDQSAAPGSKGLPRRIQPYWKAVSEARCPVSLGTTVLGVESRNSAVTVFYDNGSIETYGAVAFAVGRLGCTEHLQLPRPDLLLDENLRVWCNERGQTGLAHIYAVGSVVGFPRFAGTAVEEAEHILHQMLTDEALPKPPAFLKGKNRVPRTQAG
jgi:NAD(P) transhydrogenase